MKRILFNPLSALTVWATLVQAQLQDLWNVTTFPNEQKENVTKFLEEARILAGTDLYSYYAHRCVLGQVYPVLSNAAQTPGFVTPRKVFDRLYFVGQSAVSAWAYDTGDSLVVFDALNDTEEAEKILVPGLEALGFSGSDIKHLIITHEHFDHYGGARYLQDTYQPATYASVAAWETLATVEDGPSQDKTIADGEELTVGNVTFKFYITLGHTKGTVSAIFSVYDNGAEHPFVIGPDAFDRFLGVMAGCVRVKAARDGQNLQV